MRRMAGVALLAALLSFTANSGAETHPAAPGTKTKSHHIIHRRKSHKVRGQKAIDGDRVREIQQALIREHYLKGEPSGKWDATTQQGMRHYQADQGWQSKTVPDARALIRLGLGPDNQHLLNPESAMTTAPGQQSSAAGNALASAPETSVPSSAAGTAGAAAVSTPSSGVVSPAR